MVAGDESHVTWTDTGLRQTPTTTDSQRCEGAWRTVRLVPGLVEHLLKSPRRSAPAKTTRLARECGLSHSGRQRDLGAPDHRLSCR